MEWLGIDNCVLFRLNNNLQIKILLLPKKDDRDTLDEPKGNTLDDYFQLETSTAYWIRYLNTINRILTAILRLLQDGG